MVDQDSRKGLVASDEWHWYDKSKLPFWLRYDTWPVELGLCLICEIDPEKSEDWNIDDLVDHVNIMPGDESPHRDFKSICLLSEDPIYKLEPMEHFVGHQFAKAKQYLKDQADWLDRDDINPEYIDICDRIRLREAARKKHGECCVLFDSNPKHLEHDSFSPLYFIGWAASKEIDIPWLDWAVQNNLVKESKSAQHETKKPPAKPIEKSPEDEKEKEIVELRAAAKTVAIKLKRDGMPSRRITVKRVCEDLLKENFSSGRSFASRWESAEGMRSYLKGEHHPRKNDEFRNAKSDRPKFNR